MGIDTNEEEGRKRREPFFNLKGENQMFKYKAEIVFSITCICLSVFLAIISFNYSLEKSQTVQHTDKAPVAESSRY